jgi:uncharacterized protein involved in tolerance to divalent cations
VVAIDNNCEYGIVSIAVVSEIQRKAIAVILLTEKLPVYINIFPVESLYIWYNNIIPRKGDEQPTTNNQQSKGF